MKKFYSFLIAAIFMLAIPMGMMGQTISTTGTLNMSTSQTSPVTDNDVTFTWTSSNIVTGGGNSSGFKANSNMTVTIPSGATLKSISKVNGNNWGSGATIKVYAGTNNSGTEIASIVTGTNSYTISSNNTGTTYYFENSTGKNAWIKSLSIEYEGSGSSTYTVTYDGNGNTSGDVPVDNNEYDEENSIVTVLGNTGNLAKTGHSFGGWCLNEGGTGTVYGPGTGQTATYTISANTTFYAKWILNTHNITMPTADAYGSYSASATSNVPYGTTVTLTYAPASGYESYVATWSVNGEAITGNTFTMPDEDVTITVDLSLVKIDVINKAFIGGSSSYSAWENKTGVSGAVYAGKTLSSATQDYFQFTNSTSGNSAYAGIITTGSGGKVKKVEVNWGTTSGRTLNIYGSNTAYTATSQLYNSESYGTLLGTIVQGTSTTLNISGDYEYVGIISSSGAVYLPSISIYWEPSTNPSIIANDLNIACSATAGSISYSINNEPTPAGSLTASIVSGGTIAGLTLGTITNNSIPFTCDANTTAAEHTATVTLTYTYGDSQTYTTDVTITQAGNPDAVYLISEINAVNTNYTIKGTVVALNARSCVVGDGTGYVNFYNGYSAPSVTLGDVVKVSGNMTSYGHIYQFSANNNVGTIEAATSSNYDGTPVVTIITEIPTSYSSGLHLSDYLQFEGTLTKTSGYYYVAVGEGQINIAYPNTDQQNAMNALENKTVRVKGYFAGINSSNYFSVMMESIEEVIITNPTVTVTPSTINAPCTGADGTLALAYENITNFISFDYYFCDANGNELEDTDPDYPGDWIDAEINEGNNAYTLSYIIDANDGAARTAYVKVYTFDDNLEEVYAIVTVNQAKYVVDYATLPFAFNGGKSAIEETNGLTQSGLGNDYADENAKLRFDDTDDYVILKINERPGTLTFDIKGNGFSGGTFKVQISENGTNYTDLATYTSDNLGSTVQSQEFYNLGAGVRYIKWIYTTKSSGNVALGNIALAKYVAPQQYDLTVSLNDNVSAIYVFDAANQSNPLITDGAAGTVQVFEKTSIVISPDVAQGCILASLMVNNVNVIDQLDGSGAYTFTMPSENVTITATAMVTTTYTLATTIENGRHYIITNGDNRAMGAQSMSGTSQGNNRTAVEIYINLNDVAQVTSPDVFEFVINGPDANGFYTIYDANFPGYLYAAGASSSNHMKTQTFCDNKGQWSISFDEDNAAKIVANFSGNNARNTMRYNKNSDIFSCYASGQDPIYLYVKDETAPQYDFYKDIAGYGSNNNVATGWNFIALPVTGSFTPDATMTSNTYDLYQLNDITWQNYKDDGDNADPGFNLINGKGYLYANSDNVTLHFSGAINTFTEEGNANQKELSTGWNFIGNPYNIPIYINKPYYKMNAEGSAIETAEDIMSVAIPACTGVIVNADENETVTFSTTASKSSNNNRGNIQMALVQSVATRGESNVETIDNAIISFNEGNQLEKFYFGTQNANLYIQQGAEEYAIVSAEAQGEMPVNFKANQNGEYTISINTENVEMNYLHLIDNLTGNDVDLLATPSYTFNAMADDYASRFRLVFSANNTESNNDNFAFISDGQIVLTEQGNAQVFDVMGRMISSHNNVNHITTEGLAAGVYVIRLTTGNETMTQKIVVK